VLVFVLKTILINDLFWIMNTTYRGRQSVSARQAAVQIEDKNGQTFVIDWSVNPNAVKVDQKIQNTLILLLNS
jgi:hypothetical protein